MQQLTVLNLKEWNPKELTNYLLSNFSVDIPPAIEEPEDYKRVSKLLSDISGIYSFAMSLLMYAKVQVREARRTGNKSDVEDAIDRKNVLEDFVSIVKMQYNAVSRLISARQQATEELKMMGDSR